MKKLPELKSDEEVLEYVQNNFSSVYGCKECYFTNQLKKSRDFSQSYISICGVCKKKFKPTYLTPFHNVRFGLLKSYKVYKEIKEGRLSLYRIAIKYELTYKTVYNFSKKFNELNSENLLKLSKYIDSVRK